MMNYKKNTLVALGLSAALLGGNAYADVVVDNGVVTATGTHVTYTFNSADLGLFGPVESVSILGDTLSFAASGFNIAGSGLLEDTLQISVSAHSGYLLSSFGLEEGGSYTTGSFVDVEGMLVVEDSFSPNSNFVSAGLVASLGDGGWTAQTGTVSPLAGWGESGVFDSATLTVTNVLVALGASVSKNYVNISAIAAPVPEAETYAMMLAGLGLVGFMVRRKSESST